MNLEKDLFCKKFLKNIINNLKNSKNLLVKNDSQKITYKDAFKNIELIYSFLKKNKSNNIILFCDKSVNYYLFVIAIILAGKTWVQISPSIPFYRIKNIIKISKSNFGIYDKSFGKLLINQNSNFKIIKTDSVFKGKFKKAKISLKNINHSKTAMIFYIRIYIRAKRCKNILLQLYILCNSTS